MVTRAAVQRAEFTPPGGTLPSSDPTGKGCMYIVMNRFILNEGRNAEFEGRWKERNSYLKTQPGFVRFRLLKLDDTQYSSYAEWESEDAFRAWTQSEAFRKAHGVGIPQGLFAGPPKLECWNVVLDEPRG